MKIEPLINFPLYSRHYKLIKPRSVYPARLIVGMFAKWEGMHHTLNNIVGGGTSSSYASTPLHSGYQWLVAAKPYSHPLNHMGVLCGSNS